MGVRATMQRFGGGSIAATASVLFVCAPLAAQPAFFNQTAQSGLNFVGTHGPAFSVITHPVQQMMQRAMGNGVAVGDYDRDGDLDVYLLGQLTHANKLFRNNLDQGLKTFTDVTDFAGVGDTGQSRVAHFVDLDNDGWPDLVLINDDDGSGSYPGSKFFRNNGDGTFTDVTAGSGFAPTGYLRCGASLADYDQDGLLDIYVTNWSLELGSGTAGFPGQNLLYRNLGDFQFQDVTAAAGLGGLSRDSFTAIFADFNEDHYPDLYVAIDHTSDAFYMNNGDGTFVDVTVAIGATHTGNDMGAACADYDRDGDLDIYTTNITDPTEGPLALGTTQYNCLYDFDSQISNQFIDLAELRGVRDTYWGWGVEFFDVENDGDLDIYAVSGFEEYIEYVRGPSHPLLTTPSVLFVQGAGSSFQRVFAQGMFSARDSRGLVAFDYDRDGDLDLLTTNVNQTVELLENTSTNQGHWLDVAVVQGPGMNRGGIGVTVRATVGGVTQRMEILAGESYLTGTPAEAHFGLESAEVIDVLAIEWTDGSVTTFADVAADRFVTISGVPGDCNADLLVSPGDVAGFVAMLTGPSDADPCIADMNGDGAADGRDIPAFVAAVLAP